MYTKLVPETAHYTNHIISACVNIGRGVNIGCGVNVGCDMFLHCF